jgi:ribosomal-protein-alanine N-acetyltransferase
MKMRVETKRLILREIEASDVQGIYELDSDSEVHKYLGNKPITSMKEAENTISYIRNQYKKYGIGRWAVIDKDTNEFIGWSGLKYEEYVRTDMNYYDLGYRIKKKFWGKGIATETSKAALNYGFQIINLENIFAGAHIQNFASNRVLQKVGLKFIETFEYDGEAHNWYKIEKSNWLKSHDTGNEYSANIG